jgi:hypothetical protein
VLANMFHRFCFDRTPRMLNSFCHRSVIEDIQKRAGRFFLVPNPDYTACTLMLASVPEYTCLDEPLLIFGVSTDSIGFNACYRSKAVVEFWNELKEPLKLSPVNSLTACNSIVESLLRAGAAMPEQFDGLELNRARLYLGCLRELELLKRNGVDVAEELEELEAYRRKATFGVQIAICKALVRNRISRSRIGPAARAAKRVFRARSGVSHPTNGHVKRIEGDKNGFSNIFECAQWLPHLRETLCSGNDIG